MIDTNNLDEIAVLTAERDAWKARAEALQLLTPFDAESLANKHKCSTWLTGRGESGWSFTREGLTEFVHDILAHVVPAPLHHPGGGDSMTVTIAYEAMTFAREAHKDQRRKYTGNPYVDHLAEVAGIVAAVGGTAEMIATAWLHDTVEDQDVSTTDICRRFGRAVGYGVRMLTDCEPGNRAVRKAASRARLAEAEGWVQTIKVADLISNNSSIVQHDPQFAAVYLDEKRQLLDVLVRADPRLVGIARRQVVESGRGIDV